MSKLIFGCGYLGMRVARRWRDSGEVVYAVTRDAARAAAFARDGLRPIMADITDRETLSAGAWPAVETVLFAVGYDRRGGQSIDEVYVDGLRNAIEVLHDGVACFIYISSTGVYGDFAGEWVDEDSPCEPTRAGGRACLAAEQVIRASRLADRAIILRLAGIYGPGRLPRQDEIAAGQPITAPADGYVNLIHVDDAVEVVLAAESRGKPPQTFVVSDGHPVARRDYFREIARLIGAPEPTFTEPDATSHATERAAADKRIGTTRLMSHLHPVIRYANYREGLAAIVAAD